MDLNKTAKQINDSKTGNTEFLTQEQHRKTSDHSDLYIRYNTWLDKPDNLSEYYWFCGQIDSYDGYIACYDLKPIKVFVSPRLDGEEIYGVDVPSHNIKHFHGKWCPVYIPELPKLEG